MYFTNSDSYQFTLNKTEAVKYLILAVLIYFPLFGNLDVQVIRLWDESRLAINAYEMNKNGNWLVTFFDGKPDMWNTKPPLMIWAQTLFIKVIGANETAVRLPSAIAAFFTCAALMIFSLKYLKSFWFGFISVLILITSSGYVHEHAARTGDYDALVTLFTTLYCLSFFFFVEKNENKYLYCFFICLALAVLTKSSTGLLFGPGLIIYLLIRKHFVSTLKNKHLYIGAGIFIILVLGFYLFRESQNPGYIKAVGGNEFFGRYLGVIEQHDQSFFYYYNNFINSRFSWWWLFVPCGIIFGFFGRNEKFFRLTLFSSLLTATFLLIISTANTKLFWYDVPVYPFLAILAANFLYFIFTLLQKPDFDKNELKMKLIPLLLLFLVFITPYHKIIYKIYSTTEQSASGDYELTYFLREAVNGKHDLNNYYLSWEEYNTPNRFYLKVLQDKKINVAYKDWKKLDTNDKIIVYQQSLKDYIGANYNFAVIKEYKNITVYNINGNLYGKE